MERQWGGSALAGLLKEGPEFRLRPKESGDYQPWEDLREECSRLGGAQVQRPCGRGKLSLFKEQQGGPCGWTRVGEMKLVTWARARSCRVL